MSQVGSDPKVAMKLQRIRTFLADLQPLIITVGMNNVPGYVAALGIIMNNQQKN